MFLTLLIAMGQIVYAERLSIVQSEEPLRRELIMINSVDAADIVAVAYASGIIHPNKGSLTVDKRTNIIVAFLTENQLDRLRSVVSRLDRPSLQVKLSTYLVRTTSEHAQLLKKRISGLQYEQLKPLLNNMKKDNKGEIVVHSRVTTTNKEPAAILKDPREIPYCGCSAADYEKMIEKAKMISLQPGSYIALEVIPEILNNSHVKLSMSFGLVVGYDKKDEVEVKYERLIKEGVSGQSIVIDKIDQISETKKDEVFLMIITPFIIDNTQKIP